MVAAKVKFDPSLIEEIDCDAKVIRFRKGGWLRRITGSRLGTILGRSGFDTPFSVALSMAGVYSRYETNKYLEAGNVIEPRIRNYLRTDGKGRLAEALGLDVKSVAGIEEPADKFSCNFEHFPRGGRFGGMVDGYVIAERRRYAVLEVKTSGSRGLWTADDGTLSKVPDGYVMQASLYAELSGIGTIVFAVGFLEEKDYDAPGSWEPTEENCFVIPAEKSPETGSWMASASGWYDEYLLNGVTPQWTDADAGIVEYIMGAVGKR